MKKVLIIIQSAFILQNGSIVIDDEVMDHDKYCFNETGNYIKSEVNYCYETASDDIKQQLYPIGISYNLNRISSKTKFSSNLL